MERKISRNHRKVFIHFSEGARAPKTEARTPRKLKSPDSYFRPIPILLGIMVSRYPGVQGYPWVSRYPGIPNPDYEILSH